MIRLAVTDLDGCLMDGRGALPPDFGETFALLKENGVLLAAASGRTHAGASAPFGRYAGDMAFISDNGARVWCRGETISIQAPPQDAFWPLVQEARRHENLVTVACGKEAAWIEHTERLTEAEWQELRKYYPVWRNALWEEIPEPILKYAFLYLDDIEKNILPALKPCAGDRLTIQATAFVWIDAYEKDVAKGTGIQALQEKLGISPAETVVFGDYLNDLSMADHAARSFAPANAHPEVRRQFTDVIGYNTEGCVTATLKALLREPSAVTAGK